MTYYNKKDYIYHKGYKELVKILDYKSLTDELEVKRENGHIFRDFSYAFSIPKSGVKK